MAICDRRTGLALALSFSTLILGAPAAADAATPVFLFAGQSNMVGHGTNTNELIGGPFDYLRYPQPTVYIWGPHSSTPTPWWSRMQAPTELVEPASKYGFGPEASAGSAITAALGYQTIGVVKWAVGATALAANPAPYVYDWSWSSNELSSTLYWRHAAASTALAQAGVVGDVSAFFWMQGETDASTGPTADAYQTNLSNFIDQTRANFGKPSLPFIIGQVNPSTCAPYWAKVQAAQVNAAKTKANVSFVFTDDLARMPDDLHYTTGATVELGLRFAHAYQHHLTGVPGTGMLVNSGFEAQRISTFVGVPSTFNGGGTVSGALQGWTELSSGRDAGPCPRLRARHRPAVRGRELGLAPERGPERRQRRSLADLQHGARQAVHRPVRRCVAVAGAQRRAGFSVLLNGWTVTTKSVSTAGMPAYFTTPWQTGTIVFTASSAWTTLSFHSLRPADGTFFGPGIDNVRVH